MSFAISILAKVTVTLAIALAATRLARRSRAAVRHIVLAGAFATLLALPIAAPFAPPLRVTVPLAAQIGSVRTIAPESVATLPMTAARTRPASQPDARDATTLPSLASIVFAVWIAGGLLFLVPVLGGVWQTRALGRGARGWVPGQSIADTLRADAGMRRRVTVLRHTSVVGPATCGIVRPAIVLPADATSWTHEDLHRAIVHEFEHVRRADWLTQAVVRAIAAGYWFHPLVWLAWRQFALEAERACDDAVLRRAEATAYANQLVTLAQRMLDGRSAALAMASRGDLPSRVRALLDSSQRRGPAGGPWIAIAIVVSTVLVAAMSGLEIVSAQRVGDDPSVKFDVATIKACRGDRGADGERRPEWRMPSPGRLRIDCLTLERIIYYAYAGLGNGRSPLLNVHPLTPNLVRGGPGWIRSERFDIEAKAEGAADRATMTGPMLRALLDDRFHLKMHRATEDAPLYALVLAKGGLKIKPIDSDGCRPPDAMKDVPQTKRFEIDSGPKPSCGSFVSKGDGVNRTIYVGGETLEGFAGGALSLAVDRFVIDKTGLGGRYNIRLTYGFEPGPTPSPSDMERGPSIFTALQEQLGLKLESTKGPREFLVVDSVRPPDPD
jgi:bla regulator protein blaR1